MYKLIIVDDEKAIRDGLSKIVNWTDMGFELVAVLSDGREAIAYIKENDVDVILTDINMSFVSGLDVAKYVYENMPQIKVVLLTGYKEFEYAKQAVAYNVIDYLLKPTQLDELTAVYNKLKQQLDREFDERQQLSDVLQVVREQFFSDLIMGTFRNREDIKRCSKMIGLAINPELKCALLNISLPNYEKKVANLWGYGKDGYYVAFFNLLNIKSDIIQFFPVFNTDDNIYVIAFARDKFDFEKMKDELDKYIFNVKATTSEFLNISIEIFIENIYDNMFLVAEEHNVFRGIKENGNSKRLLEQQKILISYIQDGNYDSVINIFETIIEEFGTGNFEIFRDFIYNLFILIENKLKNLGIELNYEDQINRHYIHILDLENHDEIYLYSKVLLQDILAFVAQNRGNCESKFVQCMKEYINKNYSLDISMHDAANHVFFSTSHFGRMFKKHFNENFSDYIVKYRMLKAIEFLKNPDYKVYHISEMVGYTTLKYFYKLFKKSTGLTPTEYRMKILANKGDTDE